MFWYLIITGIIALIILSNTIWLNRGKNIQELSLLCTFLVLSFFMCARASFVGIDTREYVRAFDQIKNFRFLEMFYKPVYGLGNYKLVLEPGYRLFNWLCGVLFKNNQVIVITTSLFILAMVFLLIKQKSPYPLLSVWMYLTLGIFQTEMNISRNAIAILICYFTEDAIHTKNIWRFAVLVAVAASFHSSAMLFIPVYFLVNYIPLNRATLRRLILVTIVFTALLPFIRNSIVIAIPSGYRGYFLKSVKDYSALIVGAFYFCLFIIVMYFVKKEERINLMLNESFGTWMFLLNSMIFIMGFNMNNAARAAALFGPYLIIYLPRLINRGIQGKERIVTRVCIYIVCLVQYIGRLMINNIGYTVPYVFFWDT